MSSNTRLLIRAAQTHESVMHQGLRPQVRGWEKEPRKRGTRVWATRGPASERGVLGGKRGLLAVRRLRWVYTN
jgi:hypothetical protein